jgi:hypothetical protein
VLHRLGIDVRLRHLEEPAGKLERVGSPDALELLQEFVRHAAALPHVCTGAAISSFD